MSKEEARGAAYVISVIAVVCLAFAAAALLFQAVWNGVLVPNFGWNRLGFRWSLAIVVLLEVFLGNPASHMEKST